jgi:3-hydroxybutyryl-CoA dehydratase
MRFDELRVGASAELSRAIGDADVRAFAALTGDANPVHLDESYAAGTMFGGRIAHGMHVAGLISAVLGMRLPGPGAVYLEQSLRFRRPVRIGDTVTARVEVLDVIPERRRVRLATTCRTQHGDLVVDGEALIMVPEPAGEPPPSPQDPDGR